MAPEDTAAMDETRSESDPSPSPQHALSSARSRRMRYDSWNPRRVRYARPRKRLRAHRRRRRLLRAGIVALVLALLLTQTNGAFGAWMADAMRTVLGPQLTAQFESWYLGIQDAAHRAEYQVTGQKGSAPWNAGPAPTATPRGRAAPAPLGPPPMTLPSISPIMSPALPGEGAWSTSGLPPPAPGQSPLVAKTFLRPDAARPFAVATVLAFNLLELRLHMVAGATEPGGPRHMNGPGVIPAADQQGNHLLAAFNGGFKYADGQYGMMVNGTVYVPPQPGAATIAITTSGQVLMGAWGISPGFSSANPNLAAWRQNASLLIENGALNPLAHDGAAWGGTILNSVYTWRSGIGLTASGTLLYAAGNSLSAVTLGKTLLAAGAVTAMQTDINPYWVRAFLYSRAANGTLSIDKLHPGMQGNGTEYLQGTSRDFFYLTRNPVLPPRRVQP